MAVISKALSSNASCDSKQEQSVGSPAIADSHSHSFIFDPSYIGLPNVEVLTSPCSNHNLQILFQEPFAIFLLYESKNSRKPLRTLSLQSSSDAVARIKTAWEMGAEEVLIALASVDGSLLRVTDCNLKTWEIPFNALPALSELSVEEFSKFELDEEGSFLYWESIDVHLDMEALRFFVDSNLRDRLKAEALAYDAKFGKAIAKVRKEFGLKQDEIPNVSDRHLRRIEKEGSRPKVVTLNQLAQAHGLSLNDYLEKIAEAMGSC